MVRINIWVAGRVLQQILESSTAPSKRTNGKDAVDHRDEANKRGDAINDRKGERDDGIVS